MNCRPNPFFHSGAGSSEYCARAERLDQSGQPWCFEKIVNGETVFLVVFSEPKAHAAKIAKFFKNQIFIVAIKMVLAKFRIFIATIKIWSKMSNFYRGDKNLTSQMSNFYRGDKNLVSQMSNFYRGDKKLISQMSNFYRGDKNLVSQNVQFLSWR